MSAIVRNLATSHQGHRAFLRFVFRPTFLTPLRKPFHYTRFVALKKPDPASAANPNLSERPAKDSEDTKSSANIVHDDVTPSEHEKTENVTTETVEQLKVRTEQPKGRASRKMTRTGTSPHPRYKPVIPESFLATNYLKNSQNEYSLEQNLYSVPQSMIDELRYTVRAGLIPPSPAVDLLPARHQNLLIYIPAVGATLLQDNLVRSVTKEVNADLLTFDVQDLMMLSAGVLSAKARVNPWPLFSRSRGFNPYSAATLSVSNASMGALENEDVTVDEEEYMENEDDSISELRGEKKERERMLFPRSDSQTTNTMRLKFDLLFDTLVSAAPKEAPSASISSLSALKVIYFRDIADVVNTSFGAMILSSLMEAVHSKRRKGHKIVIIAGYSPSLLRSSFEPNGANSDIPDSNHKVPSSPSNIFLHNAVADVLSDQINLPSFNILTIPPPTSPEIARDWNLLMQHDRCLRSFEINARSVQAVCSSKGIELTEDSLEGIQNMLSRVRGIKADVWGFHRVHQLVVNAIGYAAKQQNDDAKIRLSDEHFAHAEKVILENERTRQQAVKVLVEQEQERTAQRVKKVQGIWSQKKVSMLEEECDQYEKRLLPSVVDIGDVHGSFQDVRAPPTTIETLQTLITLPLLRPELFDYGVLKRNFISGLLLFGPPGTGKTMLGKAVAKESGSRMLEIKASDVFDMYVGEGEKNVKAIFSLARKLSPCVVFIDEVDSMFNTRRSDTSSNAHREIINQFMVEWDGLRSNNKGVLLMAATNRPFDLDDAILRRMPRRILVDLPNEADRHHILSIHLRGEQLDPSISVSELAKNTAYFSGSDLKNLCVSAALAAVHEASLGLLLSSAGGTEASASSSPISPSPVSSSPASSPADTVSQHDKIPVRVLRPHHFEKALSQVTPSCSEDMYSLIEIRKWDAIYGDGAKQRNKKPVIGFGLGEVGSVASSVNNVKLAE